MRVIEQTDYADEPVVILKNTEFKHCRFVYSGEEAADPWILADGVKVVRFVGCLLVNCVAPPHAVFGELAPVPDWRAW